MKKTMYKIIFLLFLINHGVLSQENQENINVVKKSTLTATLLGFIPGAGHFYLGDYQTGGKFVTSTGFIFAYQNYLRKNTNIIQNTRVTFNPELTLFMNELQEKGYLYQSESEFREEPLPRLLLGTELEKEREFRLLRNGQYFPLGILDGDQDLYLYEINPLIRYGSYLRTNRDTAIYEILSSSFRSQSFYSAYAAYRDSGAYEDSSKQDETFSEVVTSPFRLLYFKDWRLLIPSLIVPLAVPDILPPPKSGLISPGMKREGYPLLYAVTQAGIYPALNEESVNRGIIDHSLSKKLGGFYGGVISSLLFGVLHKYPKQKIAATFVGGYLSWIFHEYNYDIKPAVFVHFWFDFLGAIVMMNKYKKMMIESNYVEMDHLQIHSMPITFYSKSF